MVRRDAAGARPAGLRARWAGSLLHVSAGALRPRSVVGPLVVLACCAVGLASLGTAIVTAVNRSHTAVGPVSDVYLSMVVGALLVLLGTVVWLQQEHRSRRDPGTAASPGTPLHAPEFQSLSLAAADPAAPPGGQPADPTDPAVAEAAGGRPTGGERPSSQMIVAYKRAAEKHSTDAARQRARAEAAEATLRELQAWIAANDEGGEVKALRTPTPTGPTRPHLARFTEACGRVVRGHRHGGASAGRGPRSDAGPLAGVEPVRGLLALAASCERQRIQDLLHRLTAESDRMLPPDRAQLAREQADHFRHAMEELSIAETVRMAEERAGTLEGRDAAHPPSRS